MGRRQLRSAAIAAACLFVLMSVGCKSVAEKAVEQASGVKVDESKGSVTVETDEGKATVTSGEGSLPEGFPESIPVYDGTITSSGSVMASGGSQFSVIIETSDDVTKVKEFYEDELPAKGWTIVMRLDTSNGSEKGAMLSAERDELTLSVAINSKPGEKTQITLIAGGK